MHIESVKDINRAEYVRALLASLGVKPKEKKPETAQIVNATVGGRWIK